MDKNGWWLHHCWIILTIDLFLLLKSRIIEIVHLNLAKVIGIYLFVGITCGLLLYFSSRIKINREILQVKRITNYAEG